MFQCSKATKISSSECLKYFGCLWTQDTGYSKLLTLWIAVRSTKMRPFLDARFLEQRRGQGVQRLTTHFRQNSRADLFPTKVLGISYIVAVRSCYLCTEYIHIIHIPLFYTWHPGMQYLVPYHSRIRDTGYKRARCSYEYCFTLQLQRASAVVRALLLILLAVLHSLCSIALV